MTRSKYAGMMQHQEAWAFNGGNQPPFRKSVMVEDHFQRGRFSTLSVSNLQIQEKVRTSGRTALIVDRTMGQQCLFGTSRAPKKGPTNPHASRAPAIPDRMRKKMPTSSMRPERPTKHATRASRHAAWRLMISPYKFQCQEARHCRV